MMVQPLRLWGGWFLLLSASTSLAAQAPGLAERERIRELVVRRDVAELRALGPEVMGELVALYGEGDPSWRASLAWVFYQLGWESEEARRALMPDVKSEEPDLRIWAQYALGRVSSDEAVVDALLENMRQGSQWLFRDKAACSLAYDQIHLSEAQKLRLFRRLVQALTDPDAGTRRLAIQVLQVQTGQDKGYRPDGSEEERSIAVEKWWRWLAEFRANLP